MAVAALGGAILGYAASQPDKSITCAAILYAAACQETGINRVAYLGVGAGIFAAGAAMAAIGGRRMPAILPMRRGLRIVKVVAWGH